MNDRSQHGSVLLYILIAVGLLALLTSVFMAPSGQQAQSQNIYKTQAALKEQIGLIQAAIQECVLTYPAGENTTSWTADAGPGGATDPDAVVAYPLKPNSTHLTAPDADRNVENIRCPGNPGGSANHADIFSGAEGKFLPPAPDFFGDWQYYNGADGVFFWIETDKSDAFLPQALSKLEEEYSECEADVVDATSGAVDLETGTATVSCTSGSYCFRYWMVRNGVGEPACP